jgi:FkbM family methyltransferase
MILRRDRTTGLMYRPTDKVIVDEVKGVYGPMPVKPDDVVLDLGAHIGATSLMALRKGAAYVVAVEADPANVPLLRRNLARRKALVMFAAVGPEPGETQFYTRSDRSYLGSRVADPSRDAVTVPMVAFAGLLAAYQPTIVKCDIEFGEYDLPELRKLPDQVRVLAMEVHIRYAGIFATMRQTNDELTARRKMAADLIAAVEAQGFREVRRKDKQAKDGEMPGEPDGIALPLMTKAVDAVWVR